MKPVFVTGVGLWAPGFPSAAAWASRQEDPAAKAPPGGMMAPGLRRRASQVTRAATDAFAEAVRAAGADPARVPSVWTSAYGEIVTTIEMLAQMATEAEGLPSPTRFNNSVHNTPAGYASIAAVNHGFSTSLAGGPRSVAVGMLEAWALLAERGSDVVLVAADEPPPPPFAPEVPFPTLAVAFHLSTEPRPGARARLSNLRQGSQACEPPQAFRSHPCVGALVLADAVLGGRMGTVPLSLTGEQDWLVDVEAV